MGSANSQVARVRGVRGSANSQVARAMAAMGAPTLRGPNAPGSPKLPTCGHPSLPTALVANQLDPHCTGCQPIGPPLHRLPRHVAVPLQLSELAESRENRQLSICHQVRVANSPLTNRVGWWGAKQNSPTHNGYILHAHRVHQQVANLRVARTGLARGCFLAFPHAHAPTNKV